jgi:oligoendopeptidase F
MSSSIPDRKDISKKHQWNLEKLFAEKADWEKGLKKLEEMIKGIESFKGTLGQSPAHLKACLDTMNEVQRLSERLGYYAMLRQSEDIRDSRRQDRYARYLSVATKVQAVSSYQDPEIQAIPDDIMEGFLESEELEPFRISLKKLLRFKPHTLSESEERLLALQAEANQTASKGFSALTDADLEFGEIDTPEGKKTLSQSTLSQFLINPNRRIREQAYSQFYAVFEQHKNTLAALYNGSVQLDIYRSKVRNYPSARFASLFPDDVPEAVYDNLVATVNANLPTIHRYYELRRNVLGVDRLKHYDLYVPLVTDVKASHTYEEAVDVVCNALAPLGENYVTTLRGGLLGNWVDRYENKGKRSGAFSAGSYTGEPYILMNYKDDVLRDVFTLAHEGGHSMHSWYSARNNPFQHYNYTIFEAEVASTVNEQLLAHYLIANAESDGMRAYLYGKQIDDIIATIVRQTMFAEYENTTHRMVEEGTPLTVDSLRSTYRDLLTKYFGSSMELEDVSDLEGLRIPHFYRAFYVYKYATGLSAAIALSRGILNGGEVEKNRYVEFLKSGGSKYPLQSLAMAGVDMRSVEPVQAALDVFSELIEKMTRLIG